MLEQFIVFNVKLCPLLALPLAPSVPRHFAHEGLKLGEVHLFEGEVRDLRVLIEHLIVQLLQMLELTLLKVGLSLLFGLAPLFLAAFLSVLLAALVLAAALAVRL